MAVETAIASHHWDVVKSREADLTHNPTTLATLEETAGGFPWRLWADAIGMPEAAHDLLIAYEPSFFEGLGAVYPGTSLDQWKQWLRWRVVASRAAYLSQEISRANFEFYGTVLSGAPQQRERWKRGVQFVEGCVGELVGQVYVARHFPPEYKEEMDQLVAHLIAAYRESITSLEWMTPETRQRALTKLDQFTPKIGYPEKWRDYSALEASADDLVGNVRASSRFDQDWEWSKVGKPVDRSEWLMTPQTVNAYYLQTANEIVFPAAILQPPFFNPEADAAVNFGGIGAVIGHEIGHGFDDQGSKYDGTGRPRQLVDRGGPRGVHRARQGADRPVRRLLPRAARRRAHGQRRAHGRREHRRPRGRRDRPQGPQDRRGAAPRRAAARRRPHGRAAVLHRLRAHRAHQAPRRGAHHADQHGPALPRGVPHQRRGAQHGRLVRGVRRDRGRRAVARAGAAASASGEASGAPSGTSGLGKRAGAGTSLAPDQLARASATLVARAAGARYTRARATPTTRSSTYIGCRASAASRRPSSLVAPAVRVPGVRAARTCEPRARAQRKRLLSPGPAGPTICGQQPRRPDWLWPHAAVRS